MKRIIKLISNLIYPAKCIFCDRVTEFGKDIYICDECKSKMSFCSEFQCCKICGKPQVSLGENGMCYECMTKTYRVYKKAASVVKYDALTSSGVKRYKDGNSEISGKIFAYLMAERVKTEFSKVTFDCMVGVAPNRKRKVKRGIDPVDVLCKYLSGYTGIPYLKGALFKIKETPKQSGLDYEHRVRNIIGSIGAKKGTCLSGKRVLLVDDVMTTGATINECAFVLKECGAKEVYAVTFATTVKEPKTYKNTEKGSAIKTDLKQKI